MKKWDVEDVCNYMKRFVLHAAPNDFVIAEPFRHGLSNDDLLMGINAFRTFLFDLFDKLAAEKNRFDPKKAALYDPENGGESTWKCFPIIKDLTALLFFVGLHGKLETHPNSEITVYGSDLLVVPKPKSEKFYGLRKLSGKRLSELFEFLSEMSFYFEELNYNDRVDLSNTGAFYISYENNNDLLVGLKLLAEAQVNIKSEHYRLESAFMRGDYRTLADTEPKKEFEITLSDYVVTQPPEIQEWLIETDKFLLSNRCRVTGDKSGVSAIEYTSRKSKKWVCKLYFGVTGCRLRPNVESMQAAGCIALDLPETMLSVIREKNCTSCYGGQPRCMGEQQSQIATSLCTHGGPFRFTQDGERFAGCRSPHHNGYKFKLENAEDRQALRKWIEQELACSK